MSTNENTPLPDDALSTPALPVRRSALLDPQKAGWPSAAEFAGTPEPQTPAVSPSACMHGLRRHWVLATTLGLLLASLAGAATYVFWGAQYTAVAYFRVETHKPRKVFTTAGAPGEGFAQSAFEVYRNTQAELVKSPDVLIAALRPPEVANLGIVQRGKRKTKDPVKWLQDELVVSFPGDAQIMAVSLTATTNEANKAEVAKVVNAVVGAYRTKVINEEQRQQADRLSDLDNVYVEKHEVVRTAMTELRALGKNVGTVDPEALKLKTQIAMQRFSHIQSQHSQARVLLGRARGDLEGQWTLLKNISDIRIPEMEVQNFVNSDPQMRSWAADLVAQRSARNQNQSLAREGSGERWTRQYDTDVRMIEDEIANLKNGVKEKIREKMSSDIERQIRKLEVQVQVLEDQEQRLAKERAEQEKEIRELSTSSIDLELMRGEIDRLNVVLTNVHAEREKVRVEVGSQARISLVGGGARVPEAESKWGIRVALTVLATVFGFCVPVAGIVWWDTRAEHIDSQVDVSRKLGLTVLGSIPKIPARALRHLGSPSNRHQTWHLRLTESIDGIAARLLHQADVGQTRVLLISSAASGEGKTTFATQLAMSLARSGRRTALVDFDLRRPAFDKVLGLPLEPGVSEVLRGQSDTSEVAHETGTDNLCVVTAGCWDRHALTALANGAAGKLFSALRAEYEFVVVDAAPILPVADTRFVSQHVDAVILSVFRDISRAPKIEAACEILEAFGVGSVEAVVIAPTDNLPDRDMKYEPSFSA
jgi:capsular exopolysaccharide synthesis family protein